jgi:hypothetical protein
MKLFQGLLVGFFLSFLLQYSVSAQGVAINIAALPADSSAQLDISSQEKGLLIPRLTQAQRGNISKPAKALLIYNVTQNQFEVNTGTPEQPAWEAIVTNQSGMLQNSFWKTGGNSIVTETGKFGSENNKPVEIITGNTLRLYIDTSGTRIGINTSNPKAGLHIATNDAIILPTGTTAQRPPQPVAGMIRFNNETGKLEGYTSQGWKSLQ